MGTSAITLSGAMQSNLLSLDNIQSSINTVQQALTTGKSVNSPTDNALVYFEAQQGYNQASSLNNLKDAMSQGLQTIQTSLQAIGTATTTLQQMQAIAQQALNTTDTTTQTNLQTQYNQLQGQLNQITQNDGNYLGTNLLSGQPNNNLVIDFNASNTSSITIRRPKASAIRLLTLSEPAVMCRKNTRCTPICAIASTVSAIGMLGAHTSVLRAR